MWCELVTKIIKSPMTYMYINISLLIININHYENDLIFNFLAKKILLIMSTNHSLRVYV